MHISRRIAAILLLEPALDANYEAVKVSTYDWPAGAGAPALSQLGPHHPHMVCVAETARRTKESDGPVPLLPPIWYEWSGATLLHHGERRLTWVSRKSSKA